MIKPVTGNNSTVPSAHIDNLGRKPQIANWADAGMVPTTSSWDTHSRHILMQNVK